MATVTYTNSAQFATLWFSSVRELPNTRSCTAFGRSLKAFSSESYPEPMEKNLIIHFLFKSEETNLPGTPGGPGRPDTPWMPFSPGEPCGPKPGGPGSPLSPGRPGIPGSPGIPISPLNATLP